MEYAAIYIIFFLFLVAILPSIIHVVLNKIKLFKGSNFIKLIIIVLVILFTIYVWPTPYRNMPNYLGSKVPFRIHRITGTGEIWIRGGWEKIK